MITPNGGVFGRNPKFNNVTVEGDLNVSGGMTVTPNATAPTSNVTIGPLAGNALQSGATNNVLIGSGAGDALQSSDENVMIGTGAGGNTTSGTRHVLIGHEAALGFTGASETVAIGYQAMRSAPAGNATVAVGSYALFSGGVFNVAVGYLAGRRNAAGTECTGTSNSIFVGYDARANADSQDNQIVIGYEGRGNGSNTTTINNASATATYIQGTATSLFSVAGDTMRITGTRTPASNAAGTAGDFCFGTDSGTTYLYYCVANGTWVRFAGTGGY